MVVDPQDKVQQNDALTFNIASTRGLRHMPAQNGDQAVSHAKVASPRRSRLLPVWAAGLALLLAGCTGGGMKLGPDAIAGLEPSGTVDMIMVQAAYIGSGSTGSGTLYFNGRSYPFSISGLGIGGIGISSIDANGDVYKLGTSAQFPGTYAQGRYGFAIGNTSAGDLWLQNEGGVIMHLKAKRSGLMLSLGGDAMIIEMK